MEPVVNADQAFEQLLYLHRSPLVSHAFVLITQLGDPRAIIVLSVSMAVILFWHKHLSYALGLAVAFFGALLSSYLLQVIVRRPRPPLVYHLITVTGYSFPSMHATVSMATYGFLCYMTWKLMHPPHHRLPWIVFLSILIALIGFSRMYLGVHYLSDVAAGFLLGGLWIWIGIRVTNRHAKSNFRSAMRAKTP